MGNTKKYLKDELLTLINESKTIEELENIEKVVDGIHFSEDDLTEIRMEILCQSDMIYDSNNNYDKYYEDRGLYSPSAPWNAPGMSVSDFI